MLARATGFYHQGTATGGSTSTIADSSAGGFDAYEDTQVKQKWAHVITDGGGSNAAPEGEARRVSSVSTTTLTVGTLYSAAVASGDVYELLSFHPRLYNDAIADAIKLAYPHLYLPLTDETLVVDNIVANHDFSAFSGSAFTGWSSKGTPTLSQETENGATFGRIVASGATEGIEQDLLTLLNRFESAHQKTLHVHGFLRCDTADSARLRVSLDGSTFTSSAWHSGSNLWERVGPFSVNLESGMTECTLSLEVEDGVTADFDLVAAWVGPITRYAIPTAFVGWPLMISMQANVLNPSGAFWPIGPGNLPIAGHLLRLDGRGHLTVPTATTGYSTDGETELNERQAEYIVASAAHIMFNRLQATDAEHEARYAARAAYWEGRAAQLMRQPGVRMVRKAAYDHKGYVRPVEDADGRYFELVR
jgi:predicted small integral membrane protein